MLAYEQPSWSRSGLLQQSVSSIEPGRGSGECRLLGLSARRRVKRYTSPREGSRSERRCDLISSSLAPAEVSALLRVSPHRKRRVATAACQGGRSELPVEAERQTRGLVSPGGDHVLRVSTAAARQEEEEARATSWQRGSGSLSGDSARRRGHGSAGDAADRASDGGEEASVCRLCGSGARASRGTRALRRHHRVKVRCPCGHPRSEARFVERRVRLRDG